MLKQAAMVLFSASVKTMWKRFKQRQSHLSTHALCRAVRQHSQD